MVPVLKFKMKRRQLQLPIQVTNPQTGHVYHLITAALEATTSPYVLLLDRTGRVVQENEPNNAELWEALAKAQGA